MDTDDNRTPGRKAEAFFDGLWRRGDPWAFETSPYDQGSYDRQLALLSDRRYARALEIGCGSGSFTRRLAPLTDYLLAIDVAPSAIEAARQGSGGGGTVDWRAANVMELQSPIEGPWDLIVLSETIYYLGWLYPLFELYWLAHRLFEAAADGSRLLMTNTLGGTHGYLQRPALIRTYRDLFVNVGYEIACEQEFQGRKNDAPLEARITMFAKPARPR